MKSPLSVPDAPAAIGPYSQAQVVRLHGGGRMLFSAGQIGLDPATGEMVAGGVAEQTARVFANLQAILRGAGLTLADVVKTTVYLADMADFQAMNEVYARHFSGPPPARTTIAAAGLPKSARVEIEVVAIGGEV
jgi:2-iminobutanoate/2-iminopropanoate deaminase